MFEAAAAAGRLLLAGIEAAAEPVLAAVSIPAPCVLPVHGNGSARGPWLTTMVHLVTGQLTLQSSSAPHLTGSVARSIQASADAGCTNDHQSAHPLPSTALSALLCDSWNKTAASQPPPGAVAWVQDGTRSQAGQYHLHPAVIDNATQASEGKCGEGKDTSVLNP